ncbi:MAG: Spy/CpxP family protein refolding chaperone [Rhizonema sp. PD37]|nr:Spy/CpxP family protein refolding chaperone [Rhizonema sp. PD37]
MLLRRVSTIVAAIVTFGSPSIFAQLISPPGVVAQTPTTSPRQNPSKPTGWLQELNLTPQQIQQINAIRKQAKEQIPQKRQAVRQAQQELYQLMSGTASTEQVRDKYNQLKTLRQELSDAEFDNTVAIRDVLNTQQRQKFASHMYKR